MPGGGVPRARPGRARPGFLLPRRRAARKAMMRRRGSSPILPSGVPAVTEIRFRNAVTPLRRNEAKTVLADVAGIVAATRPEAPLHCLRPAVISEAARAFTAA